MSFPTERKFYAKGTLLKLDPDLRLDDVEVYDSSRRFVGNSASCGRLGHGQVVMCVDDRLTYGLANVMNASGQRGWVVGSMLVRVAV